MSRDLNENDKRKRNNLLSNYYGIAEEKDVENPFDVDGRHFNPDAYVDKLVKVTITLIDTFGNITERLTIVQFYCRNPA